MSTPHLRVRYGDGRWEVIGSNASRAARTTDTKREAVDIAKEMVGPGNDKKYRVAIIEKKNGVAHQSHWAVSHRLWQIIKTSDADISDKDRKYWQNFYDDEDDPWLTVSSIGRRYVIIENDRYKHEIREKTLDRAKRDGVRQISEYAHFGKKKDEWIHPLEQEVQGNQTRRKASGKGKTIGEYLNEHDWEAQDKYGTLEYTKKQERVVDFAHERPEYTAAEAAEVLNMRAAYIRKVLRRAPGR